MKILISGSSGFVGSALVPFLTAQGHEVTRLVRAHPKPGAREIWRDPETERVNASDLEGFDAVVHLAGDPIASGRWTPEKKRRIRESRVQGTRLIAETLALISRPPRVLVSASAIGYYGDRGDEILREESPAGKGFLPEIGREWEAATQAAARKGIRVVSLRIGIVLGAGGGALQKMLPPFKLGIGGPLGSGKQYMSWIALDDVVGAIHHAIVTESLRGPANAVAPHPVTNAEFSRTLGKALRRPAVFPVPPFALRLLFGELADEALLASTRVEPVRLLGSGYRFRYPKLDGALRHVLGRRQETGIKSS